MDQHLKQGMNNSNLKQAYETRKSKEINVPIIRHGSIQGFVVTQFNYVVDLSIAKKLSTQPELFVLDEALQYIYSNERIDFSHLERIDLQAMTEYLKQRVNTRANANLLTDMGIISLNFISNDQKSPGK